MEIKELHKRLQAKNLYVEIHENSDNTITIEISGDWKHDHLYLDNLMAHWGYFKVKETELETNGSDFYVSEHQYKLIEL